MPAGKAVRDMSVQPGDSSVLAVTRFYPGFSPNHAGVAIYDNGVARPTETPGFLGAGGPNRVEFGAGGALYGYDTALSSHSFTNMTVDGDGVTVDNHLGGIIGNNNADLFYDAGRIYTDFGQIISADTLLPVGSFAANGAIAPDADTNRTYFLQGDTVTAFHNQFFVATGSFEVEDLVGSAADLVRFGDSGLAFRTTGGQVVLLDTDLVAEAFLVGDLNADGYVGAGDIDILLANWGQTVTPGSFASGDFTGDGVVGQADLDAVTANWGAGTLPGSTIPEPISAVTLLTGLALCRRRRR